MLKLINLCGLDHLPSSFTVHSLGSSEIFFTRSSNPSPEYRTLDFHINLIERTHNRLNPILIDLRKELFDRFLRLW